jgi:hypothetical protein
VPEPSKQEQLDLARLIPDNAGTVTFVDEALIVEWEDGSSSRIAEHMLAWEPRGKVRYMKREITISATPWEEVPDA